MALNKIALKTEIKSILDDMKERNEDATDEFATRLSDAIDDYVKGIQITYTTGLTASTFPVVGVFQYTVS